MTFPASVDTVTLTVGPLYDAGGALRRGVPLTVTLGRLVLIDEGGAALPTLTTASTNESGVASVVVVATDSAGIDTTGWTYHVRCDGVLTAGGIDVALPAAAPTVAIETLVAQTAADGSTVWTPGAVYSVNGETGAVVLDVATAVSDYLTANPVSLAVDDLTDVNTTGMGTGETIVYNGSSYVASSAAVILEGDSRLTDARTPTAHKTSHATGGSDALTASDIGAAATSHTHAASDITSGTVATARLGSGTADSTTFLRGDQTWATPAGGSMPRLAITPPTSTYAQGTGRVATTTTSMTLDRLYLLPAETIPGHAYTTWGMSVTAAAAAGGVLRVGLYAMDEGGSVGSLITDGGTVAIDSGTGFRGVTINHTPTQTALYIGLCVQSTASSLTVRGINNNGISMSGLYLLSNGETQGFLLQDGASGALPSTVTPTYAGQPAPIAYYY